MASSSDSWAGLNGQSPDQPSVSNDEWPPLPPPDFEWPSPPSPPNDGWPPATLPRNDGWGASALSNNTDPPRSSVPEAHDSDVRLPLRPVTSGLTQVAVTSGGSGNGSGVPKVPNVLDEVKKHGAKETSSNSFTAAQFLQ
jgi:hypothetical protein